MDSCLLELMRSGWGEGAPLFKFTKPPGTLVAQDVRPELLLEGPMIRSVWLLICSTGPGILVRVEEVWEIVTEGMKEGMNE